MSNSLQERLKRLTRRSACASDTPYARATSDVELTKSSELFVIAVYALFRQVGCMLY